MTTAYASALAAMPTLTELAAKPSGTTPCVTPRTPSVISPTNRSRKPVSQLTGPSRTHDGL
ncbi:hypothetical protein [Mycobacterium tuberculosis]|uniref:hypothetical protein n=1 Tax=Mycobacterium tuberculosis TaxID=1773 RepID=UPI003C6E8DA4